VFRSLTLNGETHEINKSFDPITQSPRKMPTVSAFISRWMEIDGAMPITCGWII